MKGRNAQVSRIYMILNILEGAPHGLSTREIHERLQERGFEVEFRTVYRDLDALRSAGFPLDEKGKTDDNGTRWTLERTTKVSHYLALDASELLSLYFARSMLLPLKDTPFYRDLQSTFDKISEKLAKTSRNYLDELQSEVIFEPGPRWGLGIDPDVVDVLRSACGERQQVEFSYRGVAGGEATTKVVGPQFLYFAKGSLYFVAEDLKSKMLKTYSVPRIEAARLLADLYESDVVQPDAYFAGSFGVFRGDRPVSVRLVFNSTVAPFIKERRWHGSQSHIDRDDGRVEVSFNLGITPDLVQWVLGFGPSVEILEPASLVETVVAQSEALLLQYRGKKGRVG
jgi:predicted DNA-binding transcriptional regulator YafY